MSTVPKKPLDRVQFYENHLAPFTAHAVAIGTSAAAVTDLTTKTSAARDAYNARQAAMDAAQTATTAWHNAWLAMSTAGAAILLNIRSKAETDGPTVYELASIAPPPTPTPVGDPGKPTDFQVQIDETGAVMLKWKCPNPPGAQGTIYQIWRKIGTSGSFTYLVGVGEKKFIDETLPAPTACVTYKIQAVRSTRKGAWAQFMVSFGNEGSGATSASVVEQAPSPKMAA